MKIPFTLLAVLLHFYGWSQEVVFKTDYGTVAITRDSTSSLLVFNDLVDNGDPLYFDCQLSVNTEDSLIVISDLRGIEFNNDIASIELKILQGEMKETVGWIIHYDTIVSEKDQATPFSKTSEGARFIRTIFDGQVYFP